jgi:hypothetical protein
MKKILLYCMVAAPAMFFAQTTILSDNFDSYTVPNTVATASAGLWTTWSGAPGSAEDALVNDSLYSSASNSMFVKNGGPTAFEHDMILPFPSTYTTGIYEFKLKIYVPQGYGGYFNLGGNWASNGAGYQYGGDFYFNEDGSGNVDAASTLPFTYNVADWNDISITVDLGAGTKTLTVNGALIGSNAWGAAAGFGVVDIFGVAYSDATNATLITSNFYVDDVELLDWTGVGLDETSFDANIAVFPNPSKGSFSVELKDALSNAYSVTITDLTGKIITSKSIEANMSTIANFDLQLSQGSYLVNVSNGVNNVVQKLIIQ